MSNLTKVRLAWKYRRQLWKYRGIIRHRKEIAGAAATGAALAAAMFLRASSRENE
ncbi:MAG: hypothetical protein LAQ30_21870 [Acidobacteriia bacterium]|nr:hypothetical protein [Terriglobia bacterium]